MWNKIVKVISLIVVSIATIAGGALFYIKVTEVPYTMMEAGSSPVLVADSFDKNWAALCPSKDITLVTVTVLWNKTPMYRIGKLAKDGSFIQLTPDGPFQDVKPDWSPDCTKVTFERLEGDLTNVYIMNADGTDIHQAMYSLDPALHAYAPTWSAHSDVIVLTISDCKKCVPEDVGSHTRFGIVRLDQGGKTYMISPPLGWGYVNNPAFDPTGYQIIFNARIGDHFQIARVRDILSPNPVWEQVTNDPYDHIRPAFLPTHDDAFLYTGIVDGRLDVYLFYNGRSFNLTKEYDPCKDPDVRKEGSLYQVIATCKKGDAPSEFVRFNLALKGEREVSNQNSSS